MVAESKEAIMYILFAGLRNEASEVTHFVKDKDDKDKEIISPQKSLYPLWL